MVFVASVDGRLHALDATTGKELWNADTIIDHKLSYSSTGAVYIAAIDKSRKAYDQAEARTKLDDETVAELQAALKAAETNLDYTNVVAPVDGTVVSRTVEIGQTVTASSDARPLFLIATDPSTSK